MTDSPTSQAMHLAMTELKERAERVAELEEALDFAKQQLDEDCFTTESKAACLDRINRLLAPVIAARYARSVLNKETNRG